MIRSMMAAALALVTLAAPASAQIRWAPNAGTHSYRYESITHVPNAPGSSYRLDYDLASDGKGGIVAIVTGAWHRERDSGEWSDAEINDACRAKLHGQGTELARVTLSPVPLDQLQGLGPAFMDECAPGDIFFPMTDILKLALVQLAPQFHLAELAKPGDSRRFDGHKTGLERLDTAVSIDSPGGTIRLVALAPERATIDFAPDPTAITIIHRRAYSGADVTLTGTDSMGFRVEIDPRTGALLSAAASQGALELTMSLPGGYSQPLAVTHEVSIVPRP